MKFKPEEIELLVSYDGIAWREIEMKDCFKNPYVYIDKGYLYVKLKVKNNNLN